MHNSDTLFDETRNLGLLDRGVRISIGAVAILSILASQSTGMLGWLALIPLFAVYPVMTGIIAYDPFYAWIGINTSSSSVFSEEYLRRMVTTVTSEDTPPTKNPDKQKSKVAKQPRNAA
ncbi:MAG: DUF2892 domain-containing protein [Gammaproteobacteria bacterium]